MEFFPIFSLICFFPFFFYFLVLCFTNFQSEAIENLPHYWSKRLEIHWIDTNYELLRKLIDLANWWCESIEFDASHITKYPILTTCQFDVDGLKHRCKRFIFSFSLYLSLLRLNSIDFILDWKTPFTFAIKIIQSFSLKNQLILLENVFKIFPHVLSKLFTVYFVKWFSTEK